MYSLFFNDWWNKQCKNNFDIKGSALTSDELSLENIDMKQILTDLILVPVEFIIMRDDWNNFVFSCWSFKIVTKLQQWKKRS